MRVDTIELLRCPAAHEAAPLVTVADARNGERLMSGTLGCPVCGTEYELRDGVVYLTPHDAGKMCVSFQRDTPLDNVLRIAALLGLAEPTGRVMLCGTHGSAASEIERVTGAYCIAVNAGAVNTSAVDAMAHGNDVTIADQLVIAVDRTLPVANASLHGLALDAKHAVLVDDATRAVCIGGRIVAPASTPVPQGLRELARDEHEWVAQVEAALTAPVQLRRG